MIHKEKYKDSNCNIYGDKDKMELYEYIDLNNYTSYFNKIENIAKQKNKFSFKVLLDDFDKNIRYNDDILNFKKDINKILIIMEKHFEMGFIYKTEQINKECLNKFYILIENEINKLIYEKNYKYYLIIKKQLYKNIKLMYNSYKKSNEKNVNEKQIVILNEIIKHNIKEYSIKINILKKYNMINKELIPYDDLLYINLNNTNEIEDILFQIDNNNKLYDNVLLPLTINIKEINQGVINNKINIYNLFNFKQFSDESKPVIKNNEHKIKIVFTIIEKSMIYFICINLFCYKELLIKYEHFYNNIKKQINTLCLFIIVYHSENIKS